MTWTIDSSAADTLFPALPVPSPEKKLAAAYSWVEWERIGNVGTGEAVARAAGAA
jgi:hypothetical protein